MDQSVRFGGTFRFDIASGRLWSGEGELRLTPKAAAVLKELVTHAGAPVSKDSLFATVWNGVAVSDDALTSCVQELRRALKDDPRRPRFAIALNPQFFDSYYYYFGRTAFAAGDIERSAELFRQASEVRLEDCQSPILRWSGRNRRSS